GVGTKPYLVQKVARVHVMGSIGKTRMEEEVHRAVQLIGEIGLGESARAADPLRKIDPAAGRIAGFRFVAGADHDGPGAESVGVISRLFPSGELVGVE